MSLDTMLERFVKAQERQATALEAIAANVSGKAPKAKKVETVEGAPPEPTAAAAPATPAPAATSVLGDAKPAATMAVVQPNATATAPDVKKIQAVVGFVCSKGKGTEVSSIFKKYGADRASTVAADKRAAAIADISALVPDAASEIAALLAA